MFSTKYDVGCTTHKNSWVSRKIGPSIDLWHAFWHSQAMAETEGNEVGRPTVVTPEVIRKLELAFSMSCTDQEACHFAGIGKTAFYEYQKENPEFADRKEALRNKGVLKARAAVFNSFEEHPNIAFKYLEKRKSGEFAVNTELPGGQFNQFNFNVNTETSKELDDLVKLECGD